MRKIPPRLKMGWGAELYDEALSRMRSGIRAQFPDASESEVEKILRQRLDRLTKIEEQGIYLVSKSRSFT